MTKSQEAVRQMFDQVEKEQDASHLQTVAKHEEIMADIGELMADIEQMGGTIMTDKAFDQYKKGVAEYAPDRDFIIGLIQGGHPKEAFTRAQLRILFALADK